MKISLELSEKIQKTIEEFVANPEPFLVGWDNTHNLREIAAKLNVLPLLFDWGHNWALRFDGEIVCFPYDNLEEIEVKDEQSYYQNMRRRAYFIAATKYLRLKELKPIRPSDAIECSTCEGTGIEPINKKLGFTEERIVCICGGLGWLPKGENYDITITNLDEFFPKTTDEK